MAIKVEKLALLRVGSGSSTVRAGWNPSSKDVVRRFSKSKGAAKALHKKTAKSATKEYQVTWGYWVLDAKGVRRFVSGTTTTVKACNATFNIPADAVEVKVSVTPVAAEYAYYVASAAGGKASYQQKTAPWYSGAASSKTLAVGATQLQPPKLQVSRGDGMGITVKMDTEDSYVTRFLLWVYCDGTRLSNPKEEIVEAGQKTCSCFVSDISPGHVYSFAAQVCDVSGRQSAKPENPQPGTEVQIEPPQPAVAPDVKAAEDCLVIGCPELKGASAYAVQYVQANDRETAENLFNMADGPTKAESEEGAIIAIPLDQLDAGKNYFFRYCGKNKNDGKVQYGPWGPLSDQPYRFGSIPTAPTVWSSRDVCTTVDGVRACWVHNCADNSEQGAYQILINGVLHSGGSETECALPVDGLSDGSSVTWQVRTRSVYSTESGWSPWSEERVVRVYVQPTVSVAVSEVVAAFPLQISVDPASPTQKPIVMDVAIRASEAHWLLSPDGTEHYVGAGDTVWSCHIAQPDDPQEVLIGAGDVILTDGQRYEAFAACVMSSGLSCTGSAEFLYDIDQPRNLVVDAEITAAGDYAVQVKPYAIDATGAPALMEPMRLAIYRVESDGTFTALVRNMPNDGTYAFTDAHAAFGSQGYRIVAIDQETGFTAFEDVASSLIDRKAVCISWQDSGIAYDDEVELAPETVLELPWNLSPSEEYTPDAEGVMHIGKLHPDAKFGTQLGARSRFSAQFEPDDKERLDLVRRLARLMREVYVREPLGTGYWAVVKPSISFSADEPFLTIDLDVERTSRTDECEVM